MTDIRCHFHSVTLKHNLKKFLYMYVNDMWYPHRDNQSQYIAKRSFIQETPRNAWTTNVFYAFLSFVHQYRYIASKTIKSRSISRLLDALILLYVINTIFQPYYFLMSFFNEYSFKFFEIVIVFRSRSTFLSVCHIQGIRRWM